MAKRKPTPHASLANFAPQRGTKWCNGDAKEEQVQAAMARFEKQAVKDGYTNIMWPGLSPIATCTSSGHVHYF